MKTIKLVVSFVFISFSFSKNGFSQLPYTQAVFNYSKDSAVSFGTVTNFCNFPFELKMNVYKPTGGTQAAKRPLVIFVHGGAFISDEDFNDPEINVMAIEFAKRGYVAASIDYREGLHLKAYPKGQPELTGNGVVFLPGWNAQARLFAADSAETIRAIYRAQQDVKAAIRYFKSRASFDSVDVCAVFLAGHSAGAITILQAAFTDRAEEKPVLSDAKTTVTNPNWKDRCDAFNPFNPAECWRLQPYGPQGRDNAAYTALNRTGDDYENAASYLRPDLGPITGDQNLSENITDEILGIGAMAGAITDTNLLVNSINFPAVFLYHQPADRVVDFYRNKPFSFYNDFLIPGPNNQWPILYGSLFIKNKLTQINYPSLVESYWYDNSAQDPFALTSHAILPYAVTIADTMAKFFAKILAAPHNCLGIVPLRSNLQATLLGNQINVRMEILESTEHVNNLILQKSTNGRDFINIKAFIPDRESFFTYIDNNPAAENFYRMEINTGSSRYFSNTIYISYGSSEVKIYPNPVFGKYLNINFKNSVIAGIGYFLIKDVQGKVIIKREIKLLDGYQTQKIDVARLPTGLYLLELINNSGEKFINSKFIKTNN